MFKPLSMNPKIDEGDFKEVINRAIKEGRHVDFLEQVLVDYEIYKDGFDRNFTDKNPKDSVYLFRANYREKKPVWREIEILGEQTFEDLAQLIVDSMGWMYDHMHGFFLPDPKRKQWMYDTACAFYAPGWEDDPYPTFKSNRIRICDLDFEKHPKLGFVFDFGDGHEFDVVFKEIRDREKRDKPDKFPCVVDMRGVAPEQYPDYEDYEDE